MVPMYVCITDYYQTLNPCPWKDKSMRVNGRAVKGLDWSSFQGRLAERQIWVDSLLTQCCGSALVSRPIRIRIQLLNSVRIRIQGAKSIGIHPDPGQTLPSQTVGFWQENHTKVNIEAMTVNQVYLLILVNLLALDPDPHSQYGSGSGALRTKSLRIRIRNTVLKVWYGKHFIQPNPPPIFHQQTHTQSHKLIIWGPFSRTASLCCALCLWIAGPGHHFWI